MKKVISILLISFITVTVNAQLANTKWKATLQLDSDVDVFFDFRNDTLEISDAGSYESFETMKYTTKDSVLTLQKLYGQSECDNTTIGTYKFDIKNEEMSLNVITDACNHRSSVIGNMKLSKSQSQ